MKGRRVSIIESDPANVNPPCDFVDHLAERLGVAHDAALSTLSDWLVQYDFDAAPHPLRPSAVARAPW